MSDYSGSLRIILITGASRGIGAAVARQLAGPHTHVVINYREKAKRAQAVADDITAAGGSASVFGADIANRPDCERLMAHLADHFGRLDALVLNASGGLERGATPQYPMLINRDAPELLARLAIPLLPDGGRIIFVTSHQAHFHGIKPVPEDYVPIAASKRAGEDRLLAMRRELSSRGVAVTVVSGDMIDGTIIVRLLQRRDPDAVAARRAHGNLPTVDEFAAAIAGAINTPTPTDEPIYVGGLDYLAEARR
jgi:NAD(P)-dependent dehydrogenase (short-subunit alcohol dehydrogenase family)